MDKRNVRNLIADQIVAKVRCSNCAGAPGANLDRDSIFAAADAVTKNLGLCIENSMRWPEPAAVLSKTGQDRLSRLVRRANHLETRISKMPPTREVGYDAGELSALRWAIEIIRNIGVIEEEGG